MSTGFPDRPGSGEPGIDQLIKALTADGYPRELAGRDEALAAFRAAKREPRRAGFPVRLGRTASAPLSVSARVGAVAAALVAGFAGLTAAAYAKALPPPVQHIAYSVLAPFGVPDSQPSSAAPRTRPQPRQAPGSARAAAHGSTSPAASATCPCPSPTPSPTSHPALPDSVLAFTATLTEVPANGYVGFSGTLTDHGRAEPGVRLLLLEQVAGTASWQQAGTGVTGKRGGIHLGVHHLTQNATFRLTGSDGLSSPSIAVTVVPRVVLRRAPAQPGTDRLVAEAKFGDAGDVVVLQEELSGGAWQSVTSQRLDSAHQASFTVAAATAGGHYYQVVLQSTTAHGAAVSNRVFEPRAHTAIGARAIESHPAPGPGLPRHGTHPHKAPHPVAPSPIASSSPSPSAPVIVISLTVVTDEPEAD